MDIITIIIGSICSIAVIASWIIAIIEKIKHPYTTYKRGFYTVGSIGDALLSTGLIYALGATLLFTIYYVLSLFSEEPMPLYYGFILAFIDWFFWRAVIKAIIEEIKSKK